MTATFKKIDEEVFERTSTKAEITILNKPQLEKTKKFLEGEIARFQAQLDNVNNNLDGVSKAKK